MSIVCQPTQADYLSAQNKQLIQQLILPSQKNKVLLIDMYTGELSTDVAKIHKQHWIIFASLSTQVTPRKISYREILCDGALAVLGQTLLLLGKVEEFQKFELKRVSHDKSIMDLFFDSVIKPILYSLKPIAPSPSEIHHQQVICHLTQHIMRVNNLPPAYLENAIKFVQDISEFIEINRHLFMTTVKATNKNLYIKAFKAKEFDDHEGNVYQYPYLSNHKFPLINYHLCGRAVQYNTDDTIYIHFTKKSPVNDQPIGRDPKKGKGTYKTVSTTIQYGLIESQQWASASSRFSFKKEAYAAGSLAHVKGILKICYRVKYYRKNPKAPFNNQKVYRMITPLCNKGDLHIAIEEDTLTMRNKDSISMQLLQTMAEVEKMGWIIRDFKAKNIFIHQEHNEEPQVFIGDLGGACHEDDWENRQRCCTTIQYLPPELAVIYSRHRFYNLDNPLPKKCLDPIAKATTLKMVSWSLGCTLWELHKAPLPWLMKYQIDVLNGYSSDQRCKSMLELIILSNSPSFLPKEKSLKLLIIKHLLASNLSERLTISDIYHWMKGLQYVTPKAEKALAVVEEVIEDANKGNEEEKKAQN